MIPGRLFWSVLSILLILAIYLPLQVASASSISPAQAAELLRSSLVQAQLSFSDDSVSAQQAVMGARVIYDTRLANPLIKDSAEAHNRVLAGFELMQAALDQGDPARFAAGRAQVWTSILAGSSVIVEKALELGDISTAQAWLSVREFRTATRFSTPRTDATMAIERLSQGQSTTTDAILTVRADLLDTYQSRLSETLRSLPDAQSNGFAIRRAELAALAEGYFYILTPAYFEQRGIKEQQRAFEAFSLLNEASFKGVGLTSAVNAVEVALKDFRAAPLSPAEQSRRAGQLLRFVYLIPVEYRRGVADGRVIHDFEIQEALTFHSAAHAAFVDLENLLANNDPDKTSQAAALIEDIAGQLASASQGQAVADPNDVQAKADALTGLLRETMPESWLKGSTQGDFDVIYTLLDQIEAAVRDGEYDLAESTRLEAYAILETGPEARLIVLSPQLKIHLENLFWNGQGENKGLAYLIHNQATLGELQSTHVELVQLLSQAQKILGEDTAPTAIAVNAGVIVFREGLEAVIILASLMSSLRRAEERRYRKPMWLGAAIAVVATILTWLLAHGVLQSLARYGEKLEAIVSLIAVGILLTIMNWFFHKVYWTSWIAQFHHRKHQLLSGEAGLVLGLVILGFSSIYREGFEVVLFLQALVLEAGIGIVLAGTAVGLIIVVVVGLITFRLQVHLPYRNMLIITGILIGVVLLQMVGKTVYVLQVVGWMPIHPLSGTSLPYWWGTWFGVYPTWEGIILQSLAAGFVISSYYLAEWMRQRNRLVTAQSL